MTPTAPAHGNLHGVLAMLAAVGCFSFMDALLKTLAGHYPVMQVAALRGLAALPLVVGYVLWKRQGRTLLRVRWGLHLLRGVLVVTMLALFTYGLQSLGLAEAYTLFFIAPLLITALSAPVLGERVRPRHWVAIGLGLLGVLVALRPDERAMMTLGGLAVLAAAACYAVSAVGRGASTRSEWSAPPHFWAPSMRAPGGGGAGQPRRRCPAPAPAPPTGGAAVAGFLGQAAITEAFRHGQAAVVAPFEYTALAWGVGLDWLLWHSLPDGATLAGGAIIIASGIYLVRSERRHG